MNHPRMNHRRRRAWCAIAATLTLVSAVAANSRAPSPEEVIDNPDCKIETTHELALLHWPLEEGTRFAVLNDTGTLFDGEVPFAPTWSTKVRFIQREDGKVLVAFAKLAYRSNVYGELDVDAPVRVFLDGKMIYQTDRAWQFDVAPDGSSLFTIGPSAEATPILTAHAVGAGTVKHSGLAERFAAHGISKPTEYSSYVAGYSFAGDEVAIMPGDVAYEDISMGRYKYSRDNGPGTYLFYSLKSGEWRAVEGRGNASYFVSSRQAYFIDRPEHDGHKDGFFIPGSETVISKKEFIWDDRGEMEEVDVWTRSIDLDGFGSLSKYWARPIGDGSWLMLMAANTHVLDAATGETVFAFPTTENLSRADGPVLSPWVASDFASEIDRHTPVGRAYHERALARLKNVMPPDATIEDVTVLSSLMVDNGELVLDQYFWQKKPRDNRSFSYIFDMKELRVDAKPISRRENPPPIWDETCRVDTDSEKGLQVSGGKLVYRSTEQSPHAD